MNTKCCIGYLLESAVFRSVRAIQVWLLVAVVYWWKEIPEGKTENNALASDNHEPGEYFW